MIALLKSLAHFMTSDSSKIFELKNNTKKTLGVMKRRISKIRNTESSLPKHLLVEKK